MYIKKNKHKRRMPIFVAERLEEAGKYNIIRIETDRVLIAQKPELFENPREGVVLIHKNRGESPNNLLESVVIEHAQQRLVASVFYGDGKEFRRPIGDNEKERRGKYLHLYPPEVIDTMIKVGGLEKMAIKLQGAKELTYFVPKTEQSDEAISVVRLSPVRLDFSLIPEGTYVSGNIQNREAENYKIPVVLGTIVDEGLQILPVRGRVVSLIK